MSCHGFGLLAPNRNEPDLSNKVLNIHFNQGASKISEIKVGGQIKIADSARFKIDTLMPGTTPADFFSISNFYL